MQHLSEISPNQTSLFGEEESMSLQEDFLVNPTALQEKEKARKMTATSGRKCLEQYERLPQSTSWGKTFLELLIGTGDWYSTKCSLIWKMKGTRSSRLYFQLVPKMHHIKETEFGLLPTPQAMLGEKGSSRSASIENGKLVNRSHSTGTKYGLQLDQIVMFLPTPTTMDHMAPKTDKAIEKEMTVTRPGRTQLSNLRDVVVRQMLPTPRNADGMKYALKKAPDKNNQSRLEYVIAEMLPTPTANCHKGGAIRTDPKRQSDTLAHHFASQTGKTSQLNPQFVQEMMGFPPDWTLIPFLKQKEEK